MSKNFIWGSGGDQTSEWEGPSPWPSLRTALAAWRRHCRSSVTNRTCSYVVESIFAVERLFKDATHSARGRRREAIFSAINIHSFAQSFIHLSVPWCGHPGSDSCSAAAHRLTVVSSDSPLNPVSSRARSGFDQLQSL